MDTRLLFAPPRLEEPVRRVPSSLPPESIREKQRSSRVPMRHFSAPNLGDLNGLGLYNCSESVQLATDLPINQPSLYQIQSSRSMNGIWVSITLLLDLVFRQIYLHLLLRLPLVYFFRVVEIFEESTLTMDDVKKMAFETAFHGKGKQINERSICNMASHYEQLEKSWNAFVDSLLRDWNTYNVVSALLSSAILTILQISDAAQDPLIRYSLLFSQICGLISLLHGCMFSIRFDSNMRKTYKAAEWASDAQKSNIWWNIWILLAMPAIWLAWSIIFYVTAVMAFVWRTNTQDNGLPGALTGGFLLLVRILITMVLGLGFVTGGLSLATFHRYGRKMDQAWARRIQAWVKEQQRTGHTSSDLYDSMVQHQPSPMARGADLERGMDMPMPVSREDIVLTYPYLQFPEPQHGSASRRNSPYKPHMPVFESISILRPDTVEFDGAEDGHCAACEDDSEALEPPAVKHS